VRLVQACTDLYKPAQDIPGLLMQEFLQPQQLLLNHTVAMIEYNSDGVIVRITNGTVLTMDYVLCTFSVGVLQNDDVVFVPERLSWKVDVLSSIDMVCRSSTLDLYLSLIDVPQYHHPRATSVPHHSAGHRCNLLWCILELAAIIHAWARAEPARDCG